MKDLKIIWETFIAVLIVATGIAAFAAIGVVLSVLGTIVGIVAIGWVMVLIVRSFISNKE